MAAPVARGNAELLIDESATQAILKFTPNPDDGAEWTVSAIQRVLAEAHLSGISTRQIEELLAAFDKSKVPISEVLVRGQAPEPAKPEYAVWQDVNTPAPLELLKDRILAAANPPELYKIRTEKIIRERRVRKPAILPFLPSKVEKVMEYETIERRDSVAVDTQIQHSFWAPAGTMVARLVPPKPGKSGKSVFGKALPADGTVDTTFYLGSGLSRLKNQIRVDSDGFIRIGSHWADLVPFAGHRFELRLSADGNTIYLDFYPGDRRFPMPDIQGILEQARKMGTPADHLIPEADLESMLSKAIRVGQPVSDMSLSCDRDAQVQLTISADKLKASITVIKGRGNGLPLELKMVSAALAEHKLKGINVDRLKADMVAFYKSSEPELRDYLLVTGTGPSRGNDRSISYSVVFMPDAKANGYLTDINANPSLSRFVKSFDDFPLSAVKRVALVRKGQEIGRFSALSLGQPGLDVYGACIPGIPGNDPIVRTFENVKVLQESMESNDDGLLLMADTDGEIKLRVLPYRDAIVEVTVDEDALTASLTLEKGHGLGKHLSLELVQKALADAGVCFGIDMKELSAALLAAREGHRVAGHVVARAKEPVPAGGLDLNWLVRMNSGAPAGLQHSDKAAYGNQQTTTIVNEGQPLLELQSIGSAGQDGTDVMGRPIKAPVDPRIVQRPDWDETIREERQANGNSHLVAARSGILLFEDNRLSIAMVQKIRGDIGPDTGNVNFPGSVAISGNVRSGYSVISGADIIIGGAVEAALVSAEGSVRVGEGVKGARRGTVRARKTIEAAFAEQAVVLAVEDVTLKSSALLCNIKTNGRLVLQGERGALIGGLCRARMGLEVQTLGSENGTRTQISFGQDYLVMDAIEAEEREIEKLKVMIIQTDRTMRKLEAEKATLDKIRQDKLKQLKLLEKRSLRIFELREKYEEHFTGEIMIRGTVHPGVILESHNRFHEVRQKKHRVVFSFDSMLGRIVERPL
jgi:hypothetical protein